MLERLKKALRETRLLDFIEELSSYLLVLAGTLTVLLILTLLSLLQISALPRGLNEAVTFVLFLPLVLDLLLVSPNLPYILTYMTLTPLLLVTVVITRIFAKEASAKLKTVEKYFEKRREEKKYGFWTLLAISLGATIGPSAFVLSPYSVERFGPLALLGMLIASLSAVALAYGYSKMFFYSMKIRGGKYVGGPSFVRNAFGSKHYLYIISRFTMWVGNVALASFNLLITIDLVVGYALPFVGLELQETLAVAARILLFVALSILVLALYKHWETMVDLQKIITSAFLALFLAHSAFLYQKAWQGGSALAGLQAFPVQPVGGGLAGLVWTTLSSAAYVYLMVFGFQEVQSLAKNVDVRDPLRYEEDIYGILKRAMVLGALISGAIFLAYMYVYVVLEQEGFGLPGTPIPPLDILKDSPLAYAITLTALSLGIFTTYIPAFVAALKHLRELLSDVFLVDMKRIGLGIDPYIVVFFMGLLLLSNAEYIIRLTDFAVLVSLALVAYSENRLMKKAAVGESSSWDRVRIAFTTIVIATIVVVFSVEMENIAVNSIVFMIFSTLAIMLFSYSLPIIELFTVIVVFLSLVLIPPLIDVIRGLAAYGLIAPTEIAIAQAVATSIWIMRIILLALIFHLALRYREELAELLRDAYNLSKKLLEEIAKL